VPLIETELTGLEYSVQRCVDVSTVFFTAVADDSSQSIAIDNKDLRTQAVARKKAPLTNASPEKQRNYTQQSIPSSIRKLPPPTPSMA
jgi:hypothetical protein